MPFGYGDSSGNRTRDTAVKGRCLNRLTMEPHQIRQRPTLPGSRPPSTIGAIELNFCVRYGNRWILNAIITGCQLSIASTGTFALCICRYPTSSPSSSSVFNRNLLLYFFHCTLKTKQCSQLFHSLIHIFLDKPSDY